MEIPVLIALAVLIVLLVGISVSTKARGRRDGSGGIKKPEGGRLRNCPLCGSPLHPGERVRSVFYPSPGDTLAEIYGCPYCDGPNAIQQRFCPVCKSNIKTGEYVIARVFKRPGKTHVHVLGCTDCRKGTR